MFKIIAYVVGCVTIALLLPLEQVLQPTFEAQIEHNAPFPDISRGNFSEHFFPCDSLTACHGWLVTPHEQTDAQATVAQQKPLIILGHGFGAQKDFGLLRYAEAFVTNGYPVFLFDYRNFGGSEGLPRHWISPDRHVSDWRSAVHYVRTELPEWVPVDTDQVCLWGTSFAGGHVLVAASEIAASGEPVTCVISQMPFMDGRKTAAKGIINRGIVPWLRLVRLSIMDTLRAWVDFPPIYIPIVGSNGEETPLTTLITPPPSREPELTIAYIQRLFLGPGGDPLALMRLPTLQLENYFAKHPKSPLGGWMNAAPARVGIELSRYVPVKYIGRIKAPVLYVMASDDELCPPHSYLIKDGDGWIMKGAPLSDQAVLLDCGHFDAYLHPNIDEALIHMLSFLATVNAG